MRPTDLLQPAAWHPGADPGCEACDGTGWNQGEALAFVPCACVGPCPDCGGASVQHGGLELCACRIARERVAALGAVGLPPPSVEAAPAAVAAWFDRYRPEDGWPWLTACGGGDGAVVRGLARLVTGLGVPVHLASSPAARWSRVVACFGLDALAPAEAERLVDTCAKRGLTLVATARLAPFPEAGVGLETRIGERAAVALYEHGEVVGVEP